MSLYKLTYFNVRGLGEHIRLMFVASGVEFEDVRIHGWDHWTEVKPKFRFGQLPVLEVDGQEISQSLTIARFLARKWNQFESQDGFRKAKGDEIIDFLCELRLEFRPWFLEEDEDKKSRLKTTLVQETFPKYLAILETLANEALLGGAGGHDHKFLDDQNPTWQDFFLANWLEIFEDTVDPTVIEKYPTLKGIQCRVFALPKISEYLQRREKMII